MEEQAELLSVSSFLFVDAFFPPACPLCVFLQAVEHELHSVDVLAVRLSALEALGRCTGALIESEQWQALSKGQAAVGKAFRAHEEAQIEAKQEKIVKAMSKRQQHKQAKSEGGSLSLSHHRHSVSFCQLT